MAASLLHKAMTEGSENCLCELHAQDYFASLCALASASCRLKLTSMDAMTDSVAARLTRQGNIQRVPHPKIELFQCRDFIGDGLSANLIQLIDKDRRPSTIADANGDDYFRTSETCDLSPDEPAVVELDSMLLALNGIDPKLGEPVQGQRYDVGQEFKAHTDYFTPGGPDYEKFCSESGQRTWTFMIYLNNVEAGGATRFKVLGKTFQPESGKLLCWNNVRPDGSVNPNTLHHGMKVRKGVKYVITKWYREREWAW